MASLVIVTGASRGYGRTVSIEFAKTVSNNLFMVLHGTDQIALQQTKEMVHAARASSALRTSTRLFNADLSAIHNLEQYAKDLFDSDAFSADEQSAFESITFLNNAGSLGPLSPIGTEVHRDAASYAKAFNVNVTACCFLTSELISRLNVESYLENCKQIDIINVSSLAAVQPFESWSLYCAGKAARDMYFRVLAEEQKKETHGRTVRVLNWAPGPMDTNMQKEIRENPTVDKATQEYFISLKEGNQLVDIEVSASKLVKLLNTPGGFESGSHVDFFDLP